jgi:uncharacterized protein (UPF0548 family)
MPEDMAGQLAAASLTYEAVGATRRALPAGYHHLRASRVIGSGEDAFIAAAAQLAAWHVQLRAGLRVTASAPVAKEGAVVLLAAWPRPLQIRAPCRVVYTVAEPGLAGFAYGTLPGHPESGEEAFMLAQDDNGLVVFTVTAFSRPATPAARAAGPLGRLLQSRLTQRYLQALTDVRTP